MVIFLQGVFERLGAGQEQASKNPALLAGDPVATAIPANKDHRWSAAGRRALVEFVCHSFEGRVHRSACRLVDALRLNSSPGPTDLTRVNAACAKRRHRIDLASGIRAPAAKPPVVGTFSSHWGQATGVRPRKAPGPRSWRDLLPKKCVLKPHIRPNHSSNSYRELIEKLALLSLHFFRLPQSNRRAILLIVNRSCFTRYTRGLALPSEWPNKSCRLFAISGLACIDRTRRTKMMRPLPKLPFGIRSTMRRYAA